MTYDPTQQWGAPQPPYQPPPPPATRRPWWKARWVPAAAAVLILLIGVGIGSSAKAKPKTKTVAGPTTSATVSVTATATAVVTTTPTVVKTIATRTRTATVTYHPTYTKYGEGTYVVGTDIQPGDYHTAGGATQCYWALLNSLNTQDIADNSNSTGPQTIHVPSSAKALEISGDCTFGRA